MKHYKLTYKDSTPAHKTLILVIFIVLTLNAITFCLAYPQAFQLPKNAVFARDFSAYYIGEWRLFHSPTQIYYGGVNPGDFQILPRPQTFKYAPSFLLLFAPFFTLNYQTALAVFDLMQFALIFILAFFIYELVKEKSVILGAVTAVVVLIDPLPSPSIYSIATADFLNLHTGTVNLQSFSPSYYCGYMLGNAHILQTTLLVGALYFGYSKKPWASALLFAFGAFDPRMALFALPLLLWYNRQALLKFAGETTAFLAATNLPFFFYHGIGQTFLHVELSGTIISQMYPYDWIPLYSIAVLTVAEAITVVNGRVNHFSFK